MPGIENPEITEHIRLSQNAAHLRADVIRQAITALNIQPGSRILDAGCGIGLQAIELARAAGKNGRVTGLDIARDILDYAAAHVLTGTERDRIELKQGSIYNIPFKDNSFDLLWSVDCAGYAEPSPDRLLTELCRVVVPGGRVALMFWAAQTLLPGHPVIEANLNATEAGIAPFKTSLQPSAHSLCLHGRMYDAGMYPVNVHTFTGHVSAPLSPEQRTALLDLLQMRWGGAINEVPEQLWSEFMRLSDPDSPDCILNRPDYLAFFTYIMVCGTVIKED